MPDKLKFLISTKLTLMGIIETSCDPAYVHVRTMDNSFVVESTIRLTPSGPPPAPAYVTLHELAPKN